MAEAQSLLVSSAEEAPVSTEHIKLASLPPATSNVEPIKVADSIAHRHKNDLATIVDRLSEERIDAVT